ncbi:MAG: ornithine cyclodeaminase family protein [Clostridium sp.]|nr:ornithine cyclodeaminase family protein [Clostridium sp.]
MLILNKEDMKKVFTMKDIIEINKEALKLYTMGKTTVPLRTNIDVKEYEGQSLYMPALVNGESSALGIKIVSTYPKNIDKDLPAVPATSVVINPETGIVECIMDGTYLTQIRTGAVQGAATEILSNKDSKIAALIGTGGQAEHQLEAMLTVRDLNEVRVYSLNKKNREKFVEKMREKFKSFGVKIIAVNSSKEAVDNADIITTVTTSRTSTFDSRDVKLGSHINGVGSYIPEMKEIPKEIIARADKIIFDTTEGVLAEAGDIIGPLEEGLVKREDYQGELGEVILGKIKGRENKNEITIFKTVGTAALDILVADKFYKKAKEMGIGKVVYL